MRPELTPPQALALLKALLATSPTGAPSMSSAKYDPLGIHDPAPRAEYGRTLMSDSTQPNLSKTKHTLPYYTPPLDSGSYGGSDQKAEG